MKGKLQMKKQSKKTKKVGSKLVWTADQANIRSSSDRIVDDMMKPSALFVALSPDSNSDERWIALCTAINPDYPKLREQW
jgi:hypothetical protein